METTETDCVALAETTVFLSFLEGSAGSSATGQGHLSARRDSALVPARRAGGSRELHRHGAFWREEAGSVAPLPTLRQRDTGHDHLGDIFATLDAEAFRRCFVTRVSALIKTPADVIAIDRKTSRRSGSRKNSKEPIHMVSAFAARQRLVMGQVAVAEKSNEIVAIRSRRCST
jgi:hypothetical protein